MLFTLGKHSDTKLNPQLDLMCLHFAVTASEICFNFLLKDVVDVKGKKDSLSHQSEQSRTFLWLLTGQHQPAARSRENQK